MAPLNNPLCTYHSSTDAKCGRDLRHSSRPRTSGTLVHWCRAVNPLCLAQRPFESRRASSWLWHCRCYGPTVGNHTSSCWDSIPVVGSCQRQRIGRRYCLQGCELWRSRRAGLIPRWLLTTGSVGGEPIKNCYV